VQNSTDELTGQKKKIRSPPGPQVATSQREREKAPMAEGRSEEKSRRQTSARGHAVT